MADNENRGLAEWAAAEVLAETPPVAVVPPPAPAPEPVAVVVEAPLAEPVVVEEPPVAEPAPEPVVAAEPEPEPTPAPAPTPPKSKIQPLPEWMKDRLGESTAKQRAAEAKAAEELAQRQVFEAENRALRERLAAAGIEAPVAEPASEPAPTPTPVAVAPQPAPAPVPPRAAVPTSSVAPPPGFVPLSQVQAEAQRIAAENAFNEKANAAYEAGIKSYPDFKDAVGVLQGMDLAGRADFQRAAMATGAMEDVIHHLGSNQDQAESIRRSLVAGDTDKAVADMTKIAVSIDAQKKARLVAEGKKPKVSAAPAPIRAVGGSALPAQVDMDKLPDEEFTVELNKMLREKGIM